MPDWAPVYAGLADAARLRAFGSVDGPTGPEVPWTQGMKDAKAAAERALALDPELAEAYVSLGGLHMLAWNLPEAERLVGRARELNPNLADAYLVLGRVYSAEGRMEDAITAFRRAAELNPLAPRILDNLAAQLDFAGRYAEGWEVIERASALQPDGSQIQCYRARLLTHLGRRDEALQQARALAENTSAEDLSFRRVEAVNVFASFGLRAEAEALATKIPVTDPEHVIALGYLGRPEEALPFFDTISFGWIDDVFWGRGFDPARGDPRWKAHFARKGLGEAEARAAAWRAAHR